jgi:hypothetical protein
MIRGEKLTALRGVVVSLWLSTIVYDNYVEPLLSLGSELADKVLGIITQSPAVLGSINVALQFS